MFQINEQLSVDDVRTAADVGKWKNRVAKLDY